MTALLLWLLTAVIASVPVFTLAWISKKIDPLLQTWRFDKRLLTAAQVLRWTLCLVVATMGVFLPLYYEYPDWPGKLYAIEDGRLVEQPWGTFEYGKTLVRMPSPDAEIAKHRTSVSPITTNPKVRRISYQITAYVTDHERYLRAKPERLNAAVGYGFAGGINKDELRKLIEYWAYELNDAKSAEFAEFYNPLSDAQQKKFRSLAQDWLNKQLAPEAATVGISEFTVQ
ncbi:hypothetical protein A3A39_00725 [Candidatus Kaiserbacteria bacterium RIFCSPLOWO2_01_FULL_54_13]|uniref:Uncharacterized protein n=1 Tax=Candidatus Kaiserbacteria bacterium RIFCSPLOWO2_01_FULL_54_13 TaxID=1798512 RepID=A0A1F6EZU5_9BACT|nr:MAG: hypothetical protein A3A39_00725 [Candidatus Kaiserbacteria bacterium RIFCSPLOWO2_01_FULL_54_13]